MVGGLLLLGGLPASGKSTVATWLLHTLDGHTYDVTIIEGDDCLKQAAAEEDEKQDHATNKAAVDSSSTLPEKSGKSATFARSREILRDKVKGALMKEVTVVSSIARLVVVVDNFQLRGMRMEMWRLCRDMNCTSSPSSTYRSLLEGTQPVADATTLTNAPSISAPFAPLRSINTSIPRWCFSEAFLDAPLPDLIDRNERRRGALVEQDGCNPLIVTIDTIRRMHATFDWGLLPLRHSVPHIVLREDKSHELDSTTTTFPTFHNTLCDWIASSCFVYAPQCHCERCCGEDSMDIGPTPTHESLLHQVDTALRGVVTEVMRRLSDQPHTIDTLLQHQYPPTLSGKVVSALKMGVLREAQLELGRGNPSQDDDCEDVVVCEKYTDRLRRLLQGGD